MIVYAFIKINLLLLYQMKEIQPALISNNQSSPAKYSHPQEHVQVGPFLKSFIYGGLDGTINILTVILSSNAINLHNNALVAIAMAAVFGQAIGMGLGDYVSFESQQQFILSERSRQEYELQHMPDEQVAEMVLLLRELDYSKEDTKRLTKLYTSNGKVFINLMMMAELGLVVDNVASWQIGLVNFCSFLIAGVIPLLPYIFAYSSQVDMIILWSAIIGGIQLFSLGYVKGIIIGGDNQNRLKSGVEIVLMGAVVIIIAAYFGSLFGK